MATAKNTRDAYSGPTDSIEKEKAALEAFFERAQLAQAPAWRPAVNDVLSGAILGFRMGHTDEYGDYPILVIKGDSGPVAFHAFHGVVRERLRELQPKKGDVLTVQYGGQVERTAEEIEKGKKEYHRYYIESGAVEATPVLDSMTF